MFHTIRELPTGVWRQFLAAPKTTLGDCVVWNGPLDRYGYGTLRFQDAGRSCRTGAHRYAYMAYRGDIPTGAVLDHLCRVRACINPHHLEAVSNRENVQRGKPLHQMQCAHGHWLTADNVWVRNGSRNCKKCGVRRKQEWRARRAA